MSRVLVSRALGALGLIVSASMGEASAQPGGCASVVTRATVARCAVEASPTVVVASVDREVAAARWQAARQWLPSNPVLSGSVARRNNGVEPTVTNWSATLSQELEVGGQRAARLAGADAERTASSQRVAGATRAAAVAAWRAYFEVLAARDEVVLARRLEALSAAIADATQAMADRGAIAGLDADLADAAASRARQARLSAEGRLAASRAVLASLLALPADTLQVEGELEPLRDVSPRAEAADRLPRPELGALEWQARAYEARSQLFARQRIPNLTLSGFAQNDGYSEHVYGIGLSLPIPLPFPVGRTYAGEIAEARAGARFVRADATRLQTEIRRDLAVARAEHDARVAERDAIAPAKYTRAETTLAALAAEVKAGKLAPRDAFVAQQTLIEFLQGRVATRRAVALASVELARAAGLPLEEGGEP